MRKPPKDKAYLRAQLERPKMLFIKSSDEVKRLWHALLDMHYRYGQSDLPEDGRAAYAAYAAYKAALGADEAEQGMYFERWAK
jgi:hypothetical protein